MTVMGIRGDIRDLDGFLASVADAEKRHKATIQLLRADRIFGAAHLTSAIEKAERSFSAGTAMAKTMGMEILLYAAAERQTSEALRKVGIQEGIQEMALAVVGDIDGRTILAELGLERDDSLLDPDGKDYSIFGISQGETESLGEAGIQELVLEKVALSEIER